MGVLNGILVAVFDAIYAPLNILPRWFSLTVLSGVVGVLALLVVKYASNQAAIGQIKDDIKANLLAIKLFKDEMRVMFGAQRRLIWAALRMQYRMIPPMLVMAVPFVLMAAQMGLRYQWRPLGIGEEVLLTAELPPDTERSNFDLRVAESDGFEVFDRIRAVADASVTWRLRPTTAGVHTIEITNGRDTYTKELAVGAGIDRVCPVRPGSNFLDQLLYPAEPAFSTVSLVRSIRLERFPDRQSWYAGADWWLLWFLVVSIVLALVLKPVLKVKF
ncbi:MAG: hypothetical protein GY842_10230 [bacterium]|nr:hypothetical protein [bacterium]